MKQRHDDLEYSWSGFFLFLVLLGVGLASLYLLYHVLLFLLGTEHV
jgi:hypothetical protein